MRKIRRIAPPGRPKLKWNVSFRSCRTGIAVDIETAFYPEPKGMFFKLERVSYLIPWEQIDAWSKAPREKLISVDRKHQKHQQKRD